MIIEDIKNDPELLSDLRNKFGPIQTLIDILELSYDGHNDIKINQYTTILVKKEIEKVKEVIKLICNKDENN